MDYLHQRNHEKLYVHRREMYNYHSMFHFRVEHHF